MANDEHLSVIEKGSEAWNAWRKQNSEIRPHLEWAKINEVNLSMVNLSWADLSEAHFNKADLRGANMAHADIRWAHLDEACLSGAVLMYGRLNNADFRAANLAEANLLGADLSLASFGSANLSGANLSKANLRETNLEGASLNRADLSGAHLHIARLGEANFSGANLIGADFSEANLYNADFSWAEMGGTIFGNNDLSTVKGLETVRHLGPSTVGIDTLYRSDGKIPEVFLRGTGIPEGFITFVPSLVGRAIEFYSCFISYSHLDEEFSQHLHSRMRRENLRVWYAPEDMKGGKKVHEEIFRAIQIHDKLLLILSKDSMQSEWVKTEIRRARKVEQEENRRKLFPIRVVDFEAIQTWECFDADSKKDLAVELREYYIPDFSNWKNHDAFEAEFAKLFRDLRATDV
jgi:uncharacterized protein YjbI with pentapeptide repeats